MTRDALLSAAPQILANAGMKMGTDGKYASAEDDFS
jgi:hypothetical protein